jgi:hypothetical protein
MKEAHCWQYELLETILSAKPIRKALVPIQKAKPSNSFKQRHPQVPVPEVIYSWVDGNRSFLVLKRVLGITLRDACGIVRYTRVYYVRVTPECV